MPPWDNQKTRCFMSAKQRVLMWTTYVARQPCFTELPHPFGNPAALAFRL